MKELDEGASRAFLGSHRVGTMALTDGHEAYGLPVFYAYDGETLFFNSRPGEKDRFLASTRRGCFVVLDVRGDDDWTSVEARGTVEKIQTNADAERAFKAIGENRSRRSSASTCTASRSAAARAPISG